MNFLELCQEVADESGTISASGEPLSVTGQSGRLRKIVNWTREAYDRIQSESDDWRWLKTEFTGSLLAGTQRYTALSLGITSRFSHWLYRENDEGPATFVYKTASGQATEGEMFFRPWEAFRTNFLRGDTATQTGTPAWFSIDDQDRLVFHPTPDATHTIRGTYYRSAQTLAADDDVPEMPARFHRAIKWNALVRLATFDEAPEQIGMFQSELTAIMNDLRGHQLPRLRIGGPLA